jgi:hypothetical protein
MYNRSRDTSLGWAHIPIWGVIVIFLETRHQKFLQTAKVVPEFEIAETKKLTKKMTYEEFDDQVNKGKKLAIFED